MIELGKVEMREVFWVLGVLCILCFCDAQDYAKHPFNVDDKTYHEANRRITNLTYEIVQEAKIAQRQIYAVQDYYVGQLSYEVGYVIGKIRERYKRMIEIYKQAHYMTKHLIYDKVKKNREILNTSIALQPGKSMYYPINWIVNMEFIHMMEVDIDKMVHVLESIPPYAFEVLGKENDDMGGHPLPILRSGSPIVQIDNDPPPQPSNDPPPRPSNDPPPRPFNDPPYPINDPSDPPNEPPPGLSNDPLRSPLDDPPGLPTNPPAGLSNDPSSPSFEPAPGLSNEPSVPSYKPSSGLSNDPPPSQSHDPPPGLYNNPSGPSNDPPAGLPNDLLAGLPIDPPAGLPNDPPAGLPNDPPAGLPNDPPAGLPNDPPAGLPNDPSGPSMKPQRPPLAFSASRFASSGNNFRTEDELKQFYRQRYRAKHGLNDRYFS